MKIEGFPELEKYWSDESVCIYNRYDFDSQEDGIGTYEVVFEVREERFYAFIDAFNMDEALALFFQLHPHVSYSMIVDHMEV